MNIKNITLLSEEEFNSSKEFIPEIELQIWWLRTPYYLPHRACAVFANSYIGNAPVSSFAIGVRPALVVENEEFVCGQKVNVLGCVWTVILIDDVNTILLCDEVVAHQRFDADNNDFEESEIKRFLEGWSQERQENPTNIVCEYKIKVCGVCATGSVFVPVDATDNDIRLAILNDLEEVSFKKVEG